MANTVGKHALLRKNGFADLLKTRHNSYPLLYLCGPRFQPSGFTTDVSEDAETEWMVAVVRDRLENHRDLRCISANGRRTH